MPSPLENQPTAAPTNKAVTASGLSAAAAAAISAIWPDLVPAPWDKPEPTFFLALVVSWLVGLGGAYVVRDKLGVPMVTVLMAIGLALMPSGARAQVIEPCRPFAAMPGFLEEGWGEHEVAQGIDGAGRLVVLYANPSTGSWSLAVRPPGSLLSCLIGTGRAYEGADPPLTGEGIEG